MTTVAVPMCFGCRWKALNAMVCAAFLEGIPEDIAMSRFDHRQPHDGDHGIRYEPDGTGRLYGIAQLAPEKVTYG